MMKSGLYVALLSAVFLMGCSDDTYKGDEEKLTLQGPAITFGAAQRNDTRAATQTNYLQGAAAAAKLGNAFNVYGLKFMPSGEASTPFNNWCVRWDEDHGGYDDNYNNWHYVDSGNVLNTGTQQIRYWDLSASDYFFVAATPTFMKFKGGTPLQANITTSLPLLRAHAQAVGGRLTHLASTPYENIVTMTEVYRRQIVHDGNTPQPVPLYFKTMQPRVRVGLYETIAGYHIGKIRFHQQSTTAASENADEWEVPGTSSYVTLYTSPVDATYFRGGEVSEAPQIVYTWSQQDGEYSSQFTWDLSHATTSSYFEAGKFTQVPASNTNTNTLYGADTDMQSLADGTTQGWFTVLPMADGDVGKDLTLRCDFVLYSDRTGRNDRPADSICVINAKAIIPAQYTKWENGKSYTYVFNISRGTGGTTGAEDPEQPGTPADDSPTGLVNINFGAVVDDDHIATATTVTMPIITVTQTGRENAVDGDLTQVQFVAGSDFEVRTDMASTVYVKTINGSFNPNVSLENQTFQETDDWTNHVLKVDDSHKYVNKNALTGLTFAAGDYILKAVSGEAFAYFRLKVVAPTTTQP